MTNRILVIDDEPQIRKFMRISLTANGYQVLEAENAAKGIAEARSSRPDLLILDLGLPDLDGQEVITAVRQFSVAPIIVLSIRADETDKVEALDRGANDYVVKPFGVAELMARVRAMLRLRPAKDGAEAIDRGSLHIDFVRRVIVKDGAELRQLRVVWDRLYRGDEVLMEALRQLRQQHLLPAAEELCSFLEASIAPGRRGPLPPQR